jgi:MFS family permease
MAACAFQSSFTGLFIATIGIAVGEAGLAPIIWSIILHLFPGRQRRLANFVYFAASLTGAAIGMVLGGVALGWLSSNPGAMSAILQGYEPWWAALPVFALPGPLFMLLVALIRVTSRKGRSQRARLRT